MIERYARPEMQDVWGDAFRLTLWTEIERVVCEFYSEKGLIPAASWRRLKRSFFELSQKGGLRPERVREIEVTTRHETLAFTTALAERLGPEARYVHFGLTSSDILDTGLALQVQAAARLIIDQLDAFIRSLDARAEQYRSLPTMGRSHGIYAEPTSFGLKFLGWREEFRRARVRILSAQEQLRFGKLSGAVGVNAHLSPAEEQKILGRLNLRREPVSTQVIPRDRHAEFILVLSLLGSSLERMAVELRHLQRTEVDEVREGFQAGQKGSSAMPHKRNPISSENLSGIARLLRGYAIPAMESVSLWHERDMSHSSVERVVFPDATILAHYALHRASSVIEALDVRDTQIRARVKSAGETVFSGHVLLALVRLGVSREEGYRWIQEAALQSLDDQTDFVSALSQNPKVAKLLKPQEIRELISLDYQLRNVDEIYRSVGLPADGESLGRKGKASIRGLVRTRSRKKGSVKLR